MPDDILKDVRILTRERENEVNWLRINNIFAELCNCSNKEFFIDNIQLLQDLLIRSILSDRSRLSGTSLDLLKHICNTCHQNIGFDTFIPVLLKLTARPNKVFFSRAIETLEVICQHVEKKTLIKNVNDNIENPNKNVRLAVFKIVKKLADCLDSFTIYIEKGLKDPAFEVRNICKQINITKDEINIIQSQEPRKKSISVITPRKINKIEDKQEIKIKNLEKEVFNITDRIKNRNINSMFFEKLSILKSEKIKNSVKNDELTPRKLDKYLDKYRPKSVAINVHNTDDEIRIKINAYKKDLNAMDAKGKNNIIKIPENPTMRNEDSQKILETYCVEDFKNRSSSFVKGGFVESGDKFNDKSTNILESERIIEYDFGFSKNLALDNKTNKRFDMNEQPENLELKKERKQNFQAIKIKNSEELESILFKTTFCKNQNEFYDDTLNKNQNYQELKESCESIIHQSPVEGLVDDRIYSDNLLKSNKSVYDFDKSSKSAIFNEEIGFEDAEINEMSRSLANISIEPLNFDEKHSDKNLKMIKNDFSNINNSSLHGKNNVNVRINEKEKGFEQHSININDEISILDFYFDAKNKSIGVIKPMFPEKISNSDSYALETEIVCENIFTEALYSAEEDNRTLIIQENLLLENDDTFKVQKNKSLENSEVVGQKIHDVFQNKNEASIKINNVHRILNAETFTDDDSTKIEKNNLLRPTFEFQSEINKGEKFIQSISSPIITSHDNQEIEEITDSIVNSNVITNSYNDF